MSCVTDAGMRFTRKGLIDRRHPALRKPSTNSCANARHSEPDFVPSLRLLIEAQEYSITDVGMMFGVSRERCRQWVNKYGIEQRGSRRGNGTRRWDDELNQFVPDKAGNFQRRDQERRVAINRAARERAMAERQAYGIAALKDLPERLHRLPTVPEMWEAVSGIRLHAHQAAPALVNWWGRQRRVAGTFAEIHEAAGFPARPIGGPGHLKNYRIRRPK